MSEYGVEFVNPPMWRCACSVWNSRYECAWCGEPRCERPVQAVPDMRYSEDHEIGAASRQRGSADETFVKCAAGLWAR